MLLEDIDQHNLEKIKRECSEFIEHNNRPLFRGMSDKGSIAQVPIRTDRRPSAASDLSSTLFNYWFSKKFGYNDIRMKTSFASTGHHQAGSYGNVYIIFPINGTKIYYNRDVDDSLSVLNDIFFVFKQSIMNYISKDAMLEFFGSLSHSERFNEDLDYILKELESYYNLSNDIIKNIKSEFDGLLEKLHDLKNYIISDTKDTIPKLPKDTEVGLFDASYYYAVKSYEIPPIQYYKEWLDSTLRK